jgi:hypothetical protein
MFKITGGTEDPLPLGVFAPWRLGVSFGASRMSQMSPNDALFENRVLRHPPHRMAWPVVVAELREGRRVARVMASGDFPNYSQLPTF